MANFPMVETGYKPEGALGGWYAGENAAYQEQMQPLMLLDQLFKMQGQDLQNQRYRGETPNYLAKSDLEGAQAKQLNTTPMLEAFSKGSEGDWMKKAAEGQIARDTQASVTGKTNAANTNEIGAQQADQYLRNLDLFESVEGNPFAASAQGLSPEIIKQFSAMDPKQRSDMRERIKTSLTDSVKQRQTLGVEDLKGQWDYWKQFLANQGAMGAASISANKASQDYLKTVYTGTVAQLRNLETVLENYAQEKSEAESYIKQVVEKGGARTAPGYPTRGSTEDKKRFESEWYKNKLASDPAVMKYKDLDSRITELRIMEKQMADELRGGKKPIKLD